MLLKKGDAIALVACSDVLTASALSCVDDLCCLLSQWGLTVKNNIDQSTPARKAMALMSAYRDPKVKMIFDVSGGNLANDILPLLDYAVIGSSDKLFVGYSDLTCVINAILCKSKKKSLLYQPLNMVKDASGLQKQAFYDTFFKGEATLFHADFTPVRENFPGCETVGGNIRCLLKLAGTPFWPEMTRKVLFLESRSGNAAAIQTYFNQLFQIGVFSQVAGIALGTFTELEASGGDAADLLLPLIPETLPVIQTKNIGHALLSAALMIGDVFDISLITK